MLTLLQAREIAERQIKEMQCSCEDFELIITDELIIEKPYAWIFYYTSKQYLETGDPHFAIAGNSPFFISKVNGQISMYRTGLSIDGMLNEYEEEHISWNLVLIDDAAYSDTKKLSAMKKTLAWAMSKITDLKCKKAPFLERGAKTKLLEIQRKLAAENITTDIVLRDLS